VYQWESAARRGLLSAIRVQLRIVALVLAPEGDVAARRGAENGCMTIDMLGRLRGEIDPVDAERLARCCSHARIPEMPAAAGYRYIDLGGEVPPMYLRRFRLGERVSAVSLTAPLEASSGLDAERGAPAIARVELSVGPRLVPWEEIAGPQLGPGDSALLARAALQAVIDLDLIEAEDCPLCAA
jgi:hypothetical protein